MSGFDGLARWYRTLEYVTFGRSLERARRCHLAALAGCERILVLGEGDGRCLRDLVDIATKAQIRVIDQSTAMLERARRRLPPAAAARVTFEQADVRRLTFPVGAYDAVVTLFVLDCFDADEVAAIVSRVRASLRPAGRWAFADFVMPPAGWRRWRAKIWIRALYLGFGLTTDLTVTSLPPSEALIARSGVLPLATTTFQGGMIHSVLFTVPHPPLHR